MSKNPITKLGRPITVGASIFVSTRFPPFLVKKLDRWAYAVGVSRSEALRQLIAAGLNSSKSNRRHGASGGTS
jgi:metal-responsive CopG/Arc/MetJ family transcriptional regulator